MGSIREMIIASVSFTIFYYLLTLFNKGKYLLNQKNYDMVVKKKIDSIQSLIQNINKNKKLKLLYADDNVATFRYKSNFLDYGIIILIRKEDDLLKIIIRNSLLIYMKVTS